LSVYFRNYLVDENYDAGRDDHQEKEEMKGGANYQEMEGLNIDNVLFIILLVIQKLVSMSRI
jgi:hypothetical protein